MDTTRPSDTTRVAPAFKIATLKAQSLDQTSRTIAPVPRSLTIQVTAFSASYLRSDGIAVTPSAAVRAWR